MPIKMLKVSFDISVETLLKAVAQENVGLDIQAYQTAAETKPKVLALEDQSPGSLREVVLGHLKTRTRATMAELQMVADQNGYHEPKKLYNLMYVLYNSRLVSRPAKSTYKITKRGIDY